MTIDVNVPVTTVVSLGLWVAGLALIVVGADLGQVGLWLAGGGGVLTMRRSLMKHHITAQRAFEMGRDFERGQQRETAELRSLR